jgi:hypothetical protein
MFSQKYITDPVIFEALRYGLIRMTTMGITGFDAPGNADESLNDASTYFERSFDTTTSLPSLPSFNDASFMVCSFFQIIYY